MRVKLTLAAAAALAVWSSGAAGAREYAAGSIRILDPWTRATAAAGGSAVGYLTITNDGAKPERLQGAECPVAATTQIHAEIGADNVMRMRPLDGIEIAPGETLKLTPGGMHLMLMGTKRRLAEGDSISCRLEFRDAGNVEVKLLVRAPGATEPLMGPMESK